MASTATAVRVGLLGGTFDPIHEGHIAIAQHVMQQFHLSRVEFIPCFQPPQRDEPGATPQQRLEMVRLAVAPHKNLIVNDCEIRAKKKSYTIHTLEKLHAENPSNEYYFIIGSDAYAKFETWKDWQKILDLSHLVVVTRTNQQLLPKKSNKILFSPIDPIAISATQIRAELLLGKKNIRGLNQAVEKYIIDNRVY